MCKNIILSEQQFNDFVRYIFENQETEGFSKGTLGRNSDRTFRFTPGKNDTNTNTEIFDKDGGFKYTKIELPKSKVVSYNLYKIASMDISRALKHKDNSGLKYDEQSIDLFMKRTALYIKKIIGNNPVDVITFPQSSSNFNSEMVRYLMRLYPNTQGIKLIPDLLKKEPKNIYVNTEVAKEIGLSPQEIHTLQSRVNGWKMDEDLRILRRKINELENEILNIKKNRGRGRPSIEFKNKEELLNTYNNQIPLLRKRGRDSTIDNNGNIKDFQIKSIGDKERRSIEGLFIINPKLNGIQQKLRGKHVVIFDDNISSGATLDDICLLLQSIGVANILPITLAVIPKTIYGAHEKI